MSSVEDSYSESAVSDQSSESKINKDNESGLEEISTASKFSKNNKILNTNKNLDTPKEASSDFAISGERSSIPDRANQKQETPRTKESFAIQQSKVSSRVNSDLELVNELKTLSKKINNLLGTSFFSAKIDLSISPYLLIISLIILLFFLKAYTILLSNLGKIPIAPSFFEVIGSFWVTKFSITHLLRKKDRQNFKQELISRWITFLGKSSEGS